MARLAMALAAFLLLPGIALSQEPTQVPAQEPASDEEPVDHTVVRGESLWFIAGRYYNDPFQWPRIYEANVGIIEDPHWIYPGEEFIIPGFGRVVLGSPEDRAVGADAAGAAAAGAPMPSPALSSSGNLYPGRGDPTVFSRPPRTNVQGPPARTAFYGSLIPGVSLAEGGVLAGSTVEHLAVPEQVFYGAPWLVPGEEETAVDYPGRVVGWAGAQSHVRDTEPIRPYDEIEVAWDDAILPLEGSRLQLVRVARSEEGFGHVIQPTAVGRVTQRGDSAVIVVVATAYDAPRVGDYVLPTAAFPLEPGEYAEDAAGNLTGRIIGFARDRTIQQLGDVAFLDVGARQGVSVGDVFGARLGSGEGWGEEIAYTLEVVRVFQNRASARITGVTVPSFDSGVTVQRIRRMP